MPIFQTPQNVKNVTIYASGDGASATTVPEQVQGLVNPGGTIDRSRAVSNSSGEELVYAPGVVDLLTKLVQIESAVLLTLAQMNHEHPNDPYDLFNQIDYLQATTQ